MTITILIPMVLLGISIIIVAIAGIGANIKHDRDIDKIRQLLRHHGIEG